MNPAILIQIIQAVIAAVPEVKKCIESICADVAAAHGLNPIELIKAVTEPAVDAVDKSIDAEINARFPEAK